MKPESNFYLFERLLPWTVYAVSIFSAMMYNLCQLCFDNIGISTLRCCMELSKTKFHIFQICVRHKRIASSLFRVLSNSATAINTLKSMYTLIHSKHTLHAYTVIHIQNCISPTTTTYRSTSNSLHYYSSSPETSVRSHYKFSFQTSSYLIFHPPPLFPSLLLLFSRNTNASPFDITTIQKGFRRTGTIEYHSRSRAFLSRRQKVKKGKASV